jgi:hypothetical protein
MSSLSNIHTVGKNSLFFGKYRYSAKFELAELGVIRGLKFDSIDKVVSDRNKWRNDHRQTFRYYSKPITAEEVKDLKTVCKHLAQYKDTIKFTVSYHRGYVYTNNLKIIKQLSLLDCINQNVYIQEAVATSPPGTLALIDPKWSHRTYFRSKNITDQERATLTEYLNSRENVRLSPGLTHWIKHSSRYWANWVQDYFFIDHNNDGEVLFLNMVVPRITGRSLQIVAK